MVQVCNRGVDSIVELVHFPEGSYVWIDIRIATSLDGSQGPVKAANNPIATSIPALISGVK